MLKGLERGLNLRSPWTWVPLFFHRLPLGPHDDYHVEETGREIEESDTVS